ncbi:hypothetical protein IFR05_010076 [Cadophora sp. M221]|nr:hypothetical protein IFR05_010076 [Cadophora sp. M221]
MDSASTMYLFYFASDVCRDLVLYDDAQSNAFRQLIPLSNKYPILLQVIIANSALHLSNAYQKSLHPIKPARSPLYPTGTEELIGADSIGARIQQFRAYKDSLLAKQRSLHLLRSALSDIAAADIDVTLAVVLLLIECELIDSGRNNWRFHVSGARTIMKRLCLSGLSNKTPLSPLRRNLISNCIVFDILGSTLTSTNDRSSDYVMSTETFSLLQDAEGNHCSSMPAILLQMIQAGSQVFQQFYAKSHPESFSAADVQQQLLLLLHTTESFDPSAWATILQARSPASDVEHRKHIAAAHRTAVCLYLCRIHLSIFPEVQLAYDLELLAADIVDNLTIIQPSDALFTATTWPAFIAGAETNDSSRQAWAMKRFLELWEVEPWGLMRGAIEVLDQIWSEKRDTSFVGNRQNGNWLVNLKERGVDWLII